MLGYPVNYWFKLNSNLMTWMRRCIARDRDTHPIRNVFIFKEAGDVVGICILLQDRTRLKIITNISSVTLSFYLHSIVSPQTTSIPSPSFFSASPFDHAEILLV
jgi:hypothetical protein